MSQQKGLALLIIFILAVSLVTPILVTGYSNLKQADAAWSQSDYKDATGLYARAARFLPWRNNLWEKAGISAGASGDTANAIIFLRRAPKLSEQGWVSLALSYFLTGDYTSALQAYQNGLNEFPSSARLYAGLAILYRLQKDWPAERSALEGQLRADTADVYAHYRLGLLLTFLDPEKALPELMLASSLDPQYDPAVQTLRTALNLSATEPDSSRQMVTIGRALGLVQEWDLSLAAFNKAIEINPDNAEAWAWLGEAQQQTGDALSVSKDQEGSAALDHALSLDQKSVIVRALRGIYWNRQGKYKQMLAEYLLAAEYEPANPAWQASIGDAYVGLGDLASALAAYQHATELAPDESTYWRLLAVFCAENGVHLEDVGLPAAQRAVQLSPGDPSALDALGLSYFSSGRYANAEQTLLDVISRTPDYLPAHLHLAMNYLAQGNRIDAYNELIHVRDEDQSGVYSGMAKQLLGKYFP